MARLLIARWTAEEESLLRELAGRDMTAQQIALKLRRSRSTVLARARLLGVTLRTDTRLPLHERRV